MLSGSYTYIHILYVIYNYMENNLPTFRPVHLYIKLRNKLSFNTASYPY